ncbi:MAG TPA: prenyltransferase/squalene oxidase repeat-containing protein [Pirellulaceae bacterium]|nr:prenyltransferase/squalene oxidase repeat-containing protein [Pirellulaceae bacterium]
MNCIRALGLLLLLVPGGLALADDEATKPKPLDEVAPRPKPVEAPTRQALDEAIRRGVDFLLADQNKDGSWGSAERTKDLNIYAPVPGAHHAFRSAVTAMCVSALLEVEDRRPEVSTAIDGGEKWLLENLPHLRRAEPMAIYNVWGHAYGISGLVRLYKHRSGYTDKQAEIKKQIEQQIELLGRYETANGGWGYYDFNAQTKKPSGEPTSFTTATVLVALHEATEIGIQVPQKLIDRGLATIRRQRKPDGSYVYDDYLLLMPQHPVNLPGGSSGRSQACNYTLRLYGDKRITDAVVRAWLDRLFARGMWLDIGRKRPIPHESWFAIAGYFFYYGHYYAAKCIEELPESDRAEMRGQLAHRLLPLQEKDGSWWDYPLYNYHQQYGTAFALMSLQYCRASAK